ncbi:MAG: hydrogenase maturation nickel metallochaperone HypA [Bryobacterales bacterium]|nr:hydrogenase maturation nickel metallochaperone HypA [Bryobacterales bacterium]
MPLRVAMHELSIIQEVVAAAVEAAEQNEATRVECVTLRVGALAGVVKEALLFCFDVASKDTLIEGARLEIIELPVRIHCPLCGEDSDLPGIQSFRCPACGEAGGKILQGRELELSSMELETA